MGKAHNKKVDQFISVFISIFCFYVFSRFEVSPTSVRSHLDCSIQACRSSEVPHRGVGVSADEYRDVRAEDRQTDDQNHDGGLHHQRSSSHPVNSKSQDGNTCRIFRFSHLHSFFAQLKSINASLKRKTLDNNDLNQISVQQF